MGHATERTLRARRKCRIGSVGARAQDVIRAVDLLNFQVTSIASTVDRLAQRLEQAFEEP